MKKMLSLRRCDTTLTPNCVGVWGTNILVVISLTVTFGLMAGVVLVSLWKTRGQPAVVEPA
jgi:tellurite resistance protein TerC